MATEIRVPTLGESVSEATVGTWFKKVGDTVKADEPLLELETDKVTIEVPSPAAGVLSEIVAAAGETVGLGALLGQIIRLSGAAAAPAAAAKKAETAAAAPAAAAATPAAPVVASAMPAAPAAAKMLAENNMSADQVDGSGKRGQVLKGDVIAAVTKEHCRSCRCCRAGQGRIARPVACRRCTTRRAREDDAPAPDHRQAPQGCPEHGGDAHHL